MPAARRSGRGLGWEARVVRRGDTPRAQPTRARIRPAVAWAEYVTMRQAGRWTPGQPESAEAGPDGRRLVADRRALHAAGPPLRRRLAGWPHANAHLGGGTRRAAAAALGGRVG